MSSEDDEDFDKTIERLTILFSKGEISEESYKKAIKTLEEEMSKSIPEGHKICPNCKKAILKGFKMCPHCLGYATSNSHNTYHVEKPTSLWYLVPFFFSIIGGIIGYVGVKNEDKKMAENLLFFGIIMFFIDLVLAWMYYQWLLSLFRF